VIPEGWKTLTLRKITGKVGLLTDGDWVESKDQDPNGSVRLVQLADIGDGCFLDKSERFMTEEKANELKCTYLERGDILIARMPNPIGRACLFPGLEMRAVTAVDVCIVRTDEQTDRRWLVYAINSFPFRKEVLRRASGSTRTRISRRNLERISLFSPPLPEQRKIADILGTWDEAIALTERRIAAARRRKKGLMQRLLTGRVRFPEFEGEEWREVHLRSVATINPPKPKHLFDDMPVSFVAMADVSEDAQITSASERPYREVSTGYTPFQDNDVIVAKITPCFENGKGALVKGLKSGVGFGSTEFHVIRANATKILPEFLYYHTVAHSFRGRGEANMAGSAGQKRVRTDFLKVYKIPLPPIAEQSRIAAVLQTCDREIELLTQKRDALQRQKKGLMQRLLTGRVRVKV
jgi:type I restriction enzyme S subunit